MAQSNVTMKAEVREAKGKRGNIQLRSQYKLPGVIYGPDLKENKLISLTYQDFDKLFHTYGKHHIITLEVGKDKIQAVIKQIKIHPISRMFLHVDFYAVSPKKPFETEVPIKYVGVPLGVKEGGALFTFKSKLRVRTTMEKLPDAIEVDISKLKQKQYMIVRDVQAVDDYKILTHEGDVLVEVK